MSKKTETVERYRVKAGCPLIQLVGVNPTVRVGPGVQEDTQRHFRAGDVLPTWVPDVELTRLVDLRFIEAVA